MPQSQIWEREGALQAIDGLVSEALSGRGRSLFIVGEAGLGKTTMVERARAGSGGRFKVSIGRGDAAESSLPFGIIDQALRGLGFRSPGQTMAGRRPTLQARAARLYAALQFLEALPSPTFLLLDALHRAVGDLPESGVDMAATRAALLRARFIGASAEERRYAQAAGVLGSRFRPGIATAMAALTPAEGDRALEALSRGGLFKSDAPGWVQFAHPLLRQTIYDEIPPPIRARWHAAAFRLLVSGGADPAEAAEHAARAGVIGDPEAVAVLAQAGRTAMREGAIARAKQWLLAAVDVAGSRAEPDVLMD